MELNEHHMTTHCLALALDYLEEVNYALVQSKMNICNWCIIENNSNADMIGIHVEISGEYVETYSSMPLNIDANGRIRLQDINLLIKIDKLRKRRNEIRNNLLIVRSEYAENCRLSKIEKILPGFKAYEHGKECKPPYRIDKND